MTGVQTCALPISREAGGPRRAIARQIESIEVGEKLELEFAPRAGASSAMGGPILNAIEIERTTTEARAR